MITDQEYSSRSGRWAPGQLAQRSGGKVASTSCVEIRANKAQQVLAPFYALPAGWQSTVPGEMLRSESVAGVPSGGRGWRILYRTPESRRLARGQQRPGLRGRAAGTRSSAGERNVIAWAHPTVGLGVACALRGLGRRGGHPGGSADFLAAGGE